MKNILSLLTLVFAILILNNVSAAQSISNITVYDLKLGDSAESLREKLISKNDKFSFLKMKAGDNDFQTYILAIDLTGTERVVTRPIELLVVGVLSDNTIFYIFRNENFREGNFPSYRGMLSEMKSRFGGDPYDGVFGLSGGQKYIWVYDSKGNFITSFGKAYSECAGFQSTTIRDIGGSSNAISIPAFEDGCGRVVEASLTAVGSDNNLVDNYKITMTDNAARLKDIQNVKQRKVDEENKKAEGKRGNF
jgi:hypothetical protein